MSGFEAEFEQFQRRIEGAVKKVLDLIKTHSSRVSEIERRVSLDEATPGLWELLKEVKGLRHEVRREVAEARESLVRELRSFRDRLREAAAAEPRHRDELMEAFDDLKEFLDDRFEEVEDGLEEFLERVEDVEDEIRDRIRELKRSVKREVYAVGLGLPFFHAYSSRHHRNTCSPLFSSLGIPHISLPSQVFQAARRSSAMFPSRLVCGGNLLVDS